MRGLAVVLGAVLLTMGLSGCARMVPGTPESLARTVPIGHGSMTFLPLSLDPEPGTNRQVVLLIAVRNNGPLPANPDPFFALVGRTFDGQPAHTAPTARASDGDFPITQRIPVGQTLVGTVAFDIPGGAALGTISVLPLAPDALPLAVWNVSDLPHGVAPAPHRSSAGGDLHPTGGTATLHGKGFSKVPQPNDQPVDEMITVAMTAVVDPAEPADPDSVALDSGDRLVAVRFDVHNIGENTYSADGAVAVLAFDT